MPAGSEKRERSQKVEHRPGSMHATSMWNQISKIVKKCEKVQKANNNFIDNFKHNELVIGLKQGEEKRLRKLIEGCDELEPHNLKQMIHQKLLSRVDKNIAKREVREEHRVGMGDPGRLAANCEKRMFFNEHIKVDDMGNKKHVVNK